MGYWICFEIHIDHQQQQQQQQQTKRPLKGFYHGKMFTIISIAIPLCCEPEHCNNTIVYSHSNANRNNSSLFSPFSLTQQKNDSFILHRKKTVFFCLIPSFYLCFVINVLYTLASNGISVQYLPKMVSLSLFYISHRKIFAHKYS